MNSKARAKKALDDAIEEYLVTHCDMRGVMTGFYAVYEFADYDGHNTTEDYGRYMAGDGMRTAQCMGLIHLAEKMEFEDYKARAGGDDGG